MEERLEMRSSPHKWFGPADSNVICSSLNSCLPPDYDHLTQEKQKVCLGTIIASVKASARIHAASGKKNKQTNWNGNAARYPLQRIRHVINIKRASNRRHVFLEWDDVNKETNRISITKAKQREGFHLHGPWLQPNALTSGCFTDGDVSNCPAANGVHHTELSSFSFQGLVTKVQF